MKIVSGMQGTRNQEISSENKDGKERNHQKRRHTHKNNKGRKQRKETRGKESLTAPVKRLGKWFLKQGIKEKTLNNGDNV